MSYHDSSRRANEYVTEARNVLRVARVVVNDYFRTVCHFRNPYRNELFEIEAHGAVCDCLTPRYTIGHEYRSVKQENILMYV